MCGTASQTIDLRTAAKGDKELTFSLSDEFFALCAEESGQDEIVGGDCTARLKVRETSPGAYELSFQVEGEVSVPCDRCQSPVAVPIEAEDTRCVRADRLRADEGGEEEDLEYISDEKAYAPAWHLYEVIRLALPLRRVHREGRCDEETARRLAELLVSDPGDESSEIKPNQHQQ